MLPPIRAGRTGIACLLEHLFRWLQVFGAYQVFSLPGRSAVCYGSWKCSYTVVLHLLLPEPQEFHSFYVKFFGLGITTLKDSISLDLTLYRFGILVSHRKPSSHPLTTVVQSPGKTEIFLVAFLGWWGVCLLAFCFSWPHGRVSCVREDVKTPASTPPRKWSAFPFEQVGRDRFVSAWLTILLEVEFLVISNQLLQKHYSRDLA